MKKKDKMECFGCKDKESRRKSGKLHMHNPITYNNRTGCSGTQLRKHELGGKKGCFNPILQNGKEVKQHLKRRD